MTVHVSSSHDPALQFHQRFTQNGDGSHTLMRSYDINAMIWAKCGVTFSTKHARSIMEQHWYDFENDNPFYKMDKDNIEKMKITWLCGTWPGFILT